MHGKIPLKTGEKREERRRTTPPREDRRCPAQLTAPKLGKFERSALFASYRKKYGTQASVHQ